MQHAHGSDPLPPWDCLQKNYLHRGSLTSLCSYIPVLSTIVGLRTLYNMQKLENTLIRRTGGFLCKSDTNTPCTWFPCSIIRREWPKARAIAIQEILGIKTLVRLKNLFMKVFRAVKDFFQKTFRFSPTVLDDESLISIPEKNSSTLSPVTEPAFETPYNL